MTRMSTIVAAGLLLCACQAPRAAERDAGACAACPEPEPPGPVRVLVLGDRTGRADDVRFRAALAQGARLKPDAILGVGDLIDGYQPEDLIAEAEAEWEEVLGVVRAVLGDLPLYLSPGNHDAWSPASEALFARVIGHPVNHSFDLGSARVIIFDTSQAEREEDLADGQLDWLVRALGEARAASARIVVTHRPLFAIGEGGTYGSPLHDVLIAGGADWVLCGHWHHAMSDDRDGIRYRMIGPSGARAHRPGHPESGNFQQLGLLTVDGDDVALSLIRVGSLLDSDTFPYGFNQLEWKIENDALHARGFEVDPVRPRSRGVFELEIANVTEEALAGALVLETPDDGWFLRPASIDVELPPGEALRRSVAYVRERGAPILPGPRVTLPVPWPGGGAYLLDTRLPPTIVRRLDHVKATPRLDGDVDEPFWERATALGPLRGEADTSLPGETLVKAAVGEGTLYVGARMEEPAAVVQRDPDAEDHMILLVDTDAADPYHVEVVAGISGRLALRRLGGAGEAIDLSDRAGCRLAVRRDARGWTAELALHLAELGVAADTRELRFNVIRVRPDPAGTTWGCWQPYAAHEPPAFGRLFW
jgi:3',5'-cyclic AMP phosphodiesterase CpdA